MFIKTIFVAVLSCSLMGLSVFENPAKGKLLRTEEGVIIIPASAEVSKQDASALADLMNSSQETVGVLFMQGKQLTETRSNSFKMEDLRGAEAAYGLEVIGDGGVFGAIFRGRNVKCHKEYSDNKCTETYKVWVDVGLRSVSGENDPAITEILDKYGYASIK